MVSKAVVKELGMKIRCTGLAIGLMWVGSMAKPVPATDSPEPELDHPVFKLPLEKGDSEAFEAVAGQLREVRILRARFEQEKKIQALRRPLRSQGKFVFSSVSGLYWQTVKPFDTVFVMTPKGIAQKSEGKTTMNILAEDQPIIHGFTQVFLAMFNGDSSVLKDKFSLYFQGDPSGWVLGLVPKGRVMSSMIHHIVLSGDSVVQKVDFVEKNGDVTHIQFAEVSINRPELSGEERTYFEIQ